MQVVFLAVVCSSNQGGYLNEILNGTALPIFVDLLGVMRREVGIGGDRRDVLAERFGKSQTGSLLGLSLTAVWTTELWARMPLVYVRLEVL